MKFYNKTLLLDHLISKQIILESDLKIYYKICSDISLKIYFYRLLDNKNWFKILFDSGELLSILNLTSDNEDIYRLQLAVCYYLEKVAKEFGNEILFLMKSTNTNNKSVYWKYLGIGHNISADKTERMIPLIKNWIRNNKIGPDLLSIEISKLLEHLQKYEKYKAALELVTTITYPIPFKKQAKSEIIKERKLKEKYPKPLVCMDIYWIKKVLNENIEELKNHLPFETAENLSKSLEKSIVIEYRNVKNKSDLSYIWRPAVEDHQQNYEFYDLKEILLVTLRDTLEIGIKKNNQLGSELIGKYLNHHYSIFRRLALHLLRVNFQKYFSFITELIKNKDLLFDIELSHEYYYLLRDIFPHLKEKDRKFIIKAIRAKKSFNKKSPKEDQEIEKRLFWYRKLYFFEKYLEGVDKDFYEKLKKEFKEVKQRDTVVWHESYSGEESPLNEDELNKKEISELWEYLKNFNPERREPGTSTIDALARTFSEMVKNNPDKYLNIDLSPLIQLKPNYSYWLIFNIAELFKKIDTKTIYEYIDNILSICTILSRIENIPNQFTDEWGLNFSGVKKQVLNLLQVLIKEHQKNFDIKYKDEIFNIIEYLCYYQNDPKDSKSDYKDEKGMDPVTRSMNSVRGTAMNTLVDYALWYAYHTKAQYEGEKYPNRLENETRVLDILEKKLDKEEETSLAIHSTFGLYLPNLSYLNRSWVKNNREKIFPKDNDKKDYWAVAFSSYISYSRFYSDIFELLILQLKRAIDYLRNGDKIVSSGFGREPGDALAEHLVIANINHSISKFTSKNNLLYQFILIKDNPHIIHLIQFISNLAKNENIFNTDFWGICKEIWNIRTKLVKRIKRNNTGVYEEDNFDREFSRYLTWLDYIPKNESLKTLYPNLLNTFKLNRKGWHLEKIINFLAKQSGKYEVEAIKLLDILIKSFSKEYLYIEKENEKNIKTIFENAFNSKNKIALNKVDLLINHLGELGYYQFKDLWKEYFYKK
ncbi:MAG: hypothetical protein JXA99_17675 [Candidatus Lokiarchaeota archaeon]|nr:hypothetical protein [Candidatus Lokiarchaeota archaeon]